jgi:aspartyl protease family protein
MKAGPYLLFGILLALTVALVLFLERQYPGTLANDDNRMVLVSRLAILAFLIASLVAGLRSHRLGPVLKALVIWVAVALVLVVGYSLRDELMPLVRRVTGNLLPAEPIALAPGVVALRASAGGHFRTVAEVNGQRVSFLVDTGASDVALTRDDARRLGIDVDHLTYNLPYRTANGTGYGARVRLNRIKIGDIVVDDIAGHVVQGDLGQALLGMSFLRRLSGFEIRGDELFLRQ